MLARTGGDEERLTWYRRYVYRVVCQPSGKGAKIGEEIVEEEEKRGYRLGGMNRFLLRLGIPGANRPACSADEPPKRWYILAKTVRAVPPDCLYPPPWKFWQGAVDPASG